MFTPDGAQFIAETRDTFVIVDPRHGKVRVLPSAPDDVRERSGFRLTADGKSIVSCFQRATTDHTAVYVLWDIRGGRELPTRLADYQFAGHEMTAPGRRPLPLAEDASVGDPCPASGVVNTNSVFTSTNGRRVALRIEIDSSSNPESALELWTIVVTMDIQTLLWKQIDYCFSAADRMQWLGESAAEAERARRCCRYL
jgi:hypothetical protein